MRFLNNLGKACCKHFQFIYMTKVCTTSLELSKHSMQSSILVISLCICVHENWLAILINLYLYQNHLCFTTLAMVASYSLTSYHRRQEGPSIFWLRGVDWPRPICDESEFRIQPIQGCIFPIGIIMEQIVNTIIIVIEPCNILFHYPACFYFIMSVFYFKILDVEFWKKIVPQCKFEIEWRVSDHHVYFCDQRLC